MSQNKEIDDISTLEGKILDKVFWGEWDGEEAIYFVTNEGETYFITHIQDCCESVDLSLNEGNLEDLKGKVLSAYESDFESGETQYDMDYSQKFYRVSTESGDAVICSYGTSNGYYSTDTEFYKLKGNFNGTH